MVFALRASALCWALGLSLVAAESALDYRVRNAPGASELETVEAVRRAIAEASLWKRDEDWKNTTTLDKSWDGAVLLKLNGGKTAAKTNSSSLKVDGGIEIVCQTCYIKGTATAELSTKGDFNASQAINQTVSQVEGNVENFTTDVKQYFENYVDRIKDDLEDGEFHFDDFALPTFNYTFEMDLPPIPQADMKFTFDGLELYLLLDTTLSLGATYTLNLYRSETPLGIEISPKLSLGVIVTMDLILEVDGEIDISSGFHIKLDDGLAFDIPLFSKNVSDIAHKGGQFEFLPVTIESAGVVLSAVLRAGVHAGVSVVSPSIPTFTVFDTNITVPSVGSGIEVGVWAEVAKFVTNVTVAPQDQKCELGVVQDYELAIGANAGATIDIGTETWGPSPNTTIAIFKTQLATVCAVKPKATDASTPTITATPAAGKRADMVTTTTTTKVTYTGVNCLTSGLVNCPVSAQNTTQSTETSTIVTVIPKGSSVVLPQSVQATVLTTIPFGSNVQKLPATSGSPTSYVPTATPGAKFIDGKVGGVSKKVIIGICVGLGIPLLIGIIAGIFFCHRRKKYSAVSQNRGTPMINEPYGHAPPQMVGQYGKPEVNVHQTEWR